MTRECSVPLQRKGFPPNHTKTEIRQVSVLLGLLLSSLYVRSPTRCVVHNSVHFQTQLTGSQASNGNDSKLFLKATTLPCCI
uniref:Uncharacterized protein n=1 Tax=Glossina palpalis gambiensis TaxID=67801 RepID=A0A1B0B1T6_9MUSC